MSQLRGGRQHTLALRRTPSQGLALFELCLRLEVVREVGVLRAVRVAMVFWTKPACLS
jgi:hypothetical protein